MIEQKYFEAYANYSVKVDRYFHCVNVFANNYNELKHIHDTLDGTYDRMEELEKVGINTDEKIKEFLFYSYIAMQKIHMTNIFSEKDPCNLGSITNDMMIYSYVTCYCYQWNLFESFISYVVDEIIKSNKLKNSILEKLKNSKGKTKKMLDTLNEEVFESSPFNHILFSADKNKDFERIEYQKLNAIRERRNSYVHSILLNDIDEDIRKLQKEYDYDMWCLRLFAQNVYTFAYNL